ncbi:MAG TPA: tetratricopeptide repeat protein [Pyrinomonadaceae bacterium]|jgi:tetratricopeptide (TPR) repeat protein|nr:tetratricopeptide repeat protein [Pyrinomonadaceae bacterium]
MRRLAWLNLLVAICATLGAAQQASVPAGEAFKQDVPSAARGTFDRATAMSRAGKGALAQALLEEALRIYPDFFDAHMALGNELFKAGRLADAMSEFEKARRINPKDDQVYLSVGLVLMQQKRYDVAASVFADASVLNPDEPLHRLMRGVALIRQASATAQSGSKNMVAERDALYRKAEVALAQAFELSGRKLPEVYLYRALIYEQRGERGRAADELELYLQADSGAGNADAIRESIRKLRDTGASVGASSSPR